MGSDQNRFAALNALNSPVLELVKRELVLLCLQLGPAEVRPDVVLWRDIFVLAVLELKNLAHEVSGVVAYVGSLSLDLFQNLHAFCSQGLVLSFTAIEALVSLKVDVCI